MKLFPYDRFKIETLLSVSQLNALFEQNVEKPRLRRFLFWQVGAPPTTLYEGRLKTNGFKLWPILGYRNSFQPTIIGAYGPGHQGSSILVVQRLNAIVMAILTIWGAVFLTMVLEGFSGSLASEQIPASGESLPMNQIVVGVLFFFFIWALTMWGFWREARHTRQGLAKVFSGVVVEL